MSAVISQTVMFDHLGEEVNVILHDGTSYWRRLIAVSEGKIMLEDHQPKIIRQEDIRSFGTQEQGLLEEVNTMKFLDLVRCRFCGRKFDLDKGRNCPDCGQRR
jgi:tRNA(Ile2) C34 agmatinyltransferase TiaS